MANRFQPTSPSRRALLGGAIGGLAAWAAAALSRTGTARAADGDPVILKATNTATDTTFINSTGASSNALQVTAPVTGLRALGDDLGVYGRGFGEAGVHGDGGGSAPGVLGRSNSPEKAAVVGWHGGFGTGLLGVSNDGVLGTLPVVHGHTGVFGYAIESAGSVGVRGESTDGIGLLGLATGSGISAFGLFARSDSTSAPAIGARSAGNSTGIIGKSGGGGFPTSKAKTGVYGYAGQDSSSKGVWGSSPGGHGVHGQSATGWAGYFDGRMLVSKYAEMIEGPTPPAPTSNRARVFVRDNGSGKTQLCVRFHSGAVKVLATES